MSAPMFARSVAYGPPCKACAAARRRIVTAGAATPVFTSIITASGTAWYACLICDQPAIDAPAWRTV